MKETRMCHPYHTKAVSSPAEQERLIKQGWTFVQPVPKTKKAAQMRALRRERLAIGWHRCDFFLEPWQAELLDSVRLPNESNAQLLTRLLLEHCSNNDKSESQANK